MPVRKAAFLIQTPTALRQLVAKCRHSSRCRVQRLYTWASFGKGVPPHPKYCSTPDFLSTRQTTSQIPLSLTWRSLGAHLPHQVCSSIHPYETYSTVLIRSWALDQIAQRTILSRNLPTAAI